MLQALILGVLQGLGEFLPISSSGHLVIAPWLFNWKDPGLGFDVALHLGTLVAVFVYFTTDIWNIIRGFYHSLFKSTRDLQNNIYQKLSWLIIIASIPGAIIGKLLESKAEHAFRNPLLIAVTLSVFGLVLLLADTLGEKMKNLNHIKWLDALIVGVSQALAIVPGVSRSGSTIAAGLFLGFKREDIARFSFLMSIPIILGAGILKLPDMREGVLAGQFTIGELLVGFASAAIVGYLSIKFMIRYVSQRSYKVFVWYRVLLTVLILAIYFSRR